MYKFCWAREHFSKIKLATWLEPLWPSVHHEKNKSFCYKIIYKEPIFDDVTKKRDDAIKERDPEKRRTALWKINELQNWATTHKYLIDRNPFKEFMTLIQETVKNNIPVTETIDDLYWLCQKYENDNFFIIVYATWVFLK